VCLQGIVVFGWVPQLCLIDVVKFVPSYSFASQQMLYEVFLSGPAVLIKVSATSE
jgi:hypothetical protein